MSNKCELPQHEIDALVRHFLPQIKAFSKVQRDRENMKYGDKNKKPKAKLELSLE